MNNTLADCDYARTALRKVLANDEEYDRLISIFDSKYNVYDKETEIKVMTILKEAALKGIDTSSINNIDEVSRIWHFMQTV